MFNYTFKLTTTVYSNRELTFVVIKAESEDQAWQLLDSRPDAMTRNQKRSLLRSKTKPA